MPAPIDTWTAADNYLADLFLPPDPALDAALAASAAAGFPEIQVSPLQGKFLYLLARMQRASKILELGTLGGYSTIWLARAMTPGGRLISLEYEPKHAEVARANIARAGLAECVEIRVGPALETLPKLLAEGCGPFDLFFIDADKEGYCDYLDWAVKLSRPGSLIIADNVVREGAVAQPSENSTVAGVQRFNEKLARDPRLVSTVIQVVGCKGHDGLALAVVR